MIMASNEEVPCCLFLGHKNGLSNPKMTVCSAKEEGG